MEDSKRVDIVQVSQFFLFVVVGTYLLYLGKNLLYPFVFAILFALFLNPICSFFQKYLRNRILSIFLGFLSVLIPLSLVASLFLGQFSQVIRDIGVIRQRLTIVATNIQNWVNQYIPFSREDGFDFLAKNIPSLMEKPLDFLSASISTSTNIVSNFFLIALYTFFFLYYKDGIKGFLHQQYGFRERSSVTSMFSEMAGVTKNYLIGLALVIGVLAILNSLGLMIIGISHPFFWGCFAAFLVIIPYIGTILGGLLPFLYAFATTDTLWQPLAVAGLFITVQTLEGNFITPQVVGNQININPFAAIISLVLGGLIWGIAGLVLALPVLAVFKVFCSHNNRLKPIGFLLSDELSDKPDTFLEQWDEAKYRLLEIFLNK